MGENLLKIEEVITNGGEMLNQVFSGSDDSLYPKNIIFGGDMNLDSPVVKNPEDLTMQKDKSYTWLIDNDDDTNVNDNTEAAFDRIIVHGEKVTNSICTENKS